MTAYAELQVTTNFSFLRGASHAHELVATAKALGMTAIAVTDRNTLAGIVRGHSAAKQLGLRFVVGVRFDFADGTPSVLCYPTDRAAYGRMTRLLSKGQLAAEKGACKLAYEDLLEHGEGQVLIVVAPARLGKDDPVEAAKPETAEIIPFPSPFESIAATKVHVILGGGAVAPQTRDLSNVEAETPSLMQGLDLRRGQVPALRGCRRGACPGTRQRREPEGRDDVNSASSPPSFPDHLARFARDFPGCVYLAATRLYGAQDAKRLHRLAAFAKAAGTPLVATGDVLYHASERRPLQDVLTAIREKCTIAEAGLRLEANAERRLKSPAEMARLFAAHPDAIARTQEIVARCGFSLDELRYEYPDEPVPPGKTAQAHLEDLTWAGAAWRYPDGVPEKVRQALLKELAFIAEKELPHYFLTVHDIVRWARTAPKKDGRKTEILCQGRGSAANSAVCFCLGVTAVDPTETPLLFDRFMSKERDEPPDIDVDFEHERREEVIQYIYERYGRHRAAICATVIHYRSRSAIRDVGKALGLTDDITAALADTVWGSWGGRGDRRTVDDDSVEGPDVGLPDEHVRQAGLDPANEQIRRAVDLAQQLLDFPRHLSQHVGGFVLTKGLLTETVPIGNAAMEDRTFIEWDKDDIEALGLMKVDVLALGMLTAIRKALDFLKERKGIDIPDIALIPKEDPAVYDMLSRGDSVGVFQVESRAQMSMLPRLRPKEFYDLVIEVAIVRPGPIQGDMVHPYLRRRDGTDPVVYPAPSPEHGPPDELEQVLGRTKGVPLFQEQAMSLAITAAKFTPEEANGLRRAMATFKSDGKIYLYKDKFIGGMIARGYAQEFAERCYKQIEGFGSYGFPESHAASFAKLVYVSAWIKRHHPDAFCAAILNSQPMGFYHPAQLVRDAREHGVEVRPPDVFASDWDCTLEDLSPACGMKAVRLGLRQVAGLPEDEARKIVAVRQAGASTLEEIARRAGLARGVLERVAEADAFRSKDLDRRRALWRATGLKGERKLASEAPLLEAIAPASDADADDLLPVMPLSENVAEDYRTVGLSLKAHPCSFFRDALDKKRVTPAEGLERIAHGRKVRAAGLVLNRQRPGTAKNVMFATLEDETGIVNLVIWDRIFQENRRVLMTSGFLLVEGQVQKASGVIHVIVERTFDLTGSLSKLRGEGGAAEPMQPSRDFH